MSESLDLSLLFGTESQRWHISNLLLDTLKTRGVAKLKNHGIPNDTVNRLFEHTANFFNLPHEVKLSAAHPPNSTPNRGYSYVGQESVSAISGFEKGLPQGKAIRDIKETFDLGSARDDLVDNIWMDDSKLPGFRAFMEDFYERCFELEKQILAALARALEIPESQLVAMHDKAENEFRLLHYPAIPSSQLRNGTATRIAEHTDFGTITIIFQDSTGGLQVESQDQARAGTFHGVESTKGEIILNIGDSFQRLTNDTFRAACHRVTYPPTVKEGSEELVPKRFSIAYFAKPNRNASLLPFKEFTSKVNPCRYDDITAWDYNNLRITKLYA